MSRSPSAQRLFLGMSVGALLLWPHPGFGQTSVLTYHYDNARTGQNTHETVLTPAKVRAPDRFARLFTIRFHDVDAPGEVDGDVFAQPLYVPNLILGSHTPQAGTKHNVLFVVTEGDMVYAFDADNRDGPNASPLWKANLLAISRGAGAGAIPVPNGDIDPCSNMPPQIGITGTPVIDPSNGTLYVVAKTKELIAGVAHYILRLHALSITNGAEWPNSPVVMGDTALGSSGSFINTTNIFVPGTGDGTDGTNVKFNVLRENQRVGLLLQNGLVYVATGSHCDTTPFHGWIVAYNARTLAQVAVFCTTPNGYDGGIWMEGDGLAADANGDLFVTTGNGTFDTAFDAKGFPSNHDFGDSIVRLDPNLNVLDYFTPFNQAYMGGSADQDLGSGGVLLIPDQPGSHPHLLTQAGKVGTIYLVDRDNMGHFCSGCTANTNIVQEITKGVANTPVPIYWDGSVYFHGDADVVKAFALNNGQLTNPPSHQTTEIYSGGIVISSNGNHDGIVWSLKTDGAENNPPAPAALNAYDAVTLSKLYSSERKIDDSPGQAVTFATPIEASGKVYVGSRTQLAVFGLDTVRVEVNNVQHRGANWCGTVSAVDTATNRQVQGTVYINGNAIGPTNQQLCLRPPTCLTPSCMTTVTIKFASFPTKEIRIKIR